MSEESNTSENDYNESSESTDDDDDDSSNDSEEETRIVISEIFGPNNVKLTIKNGKILDSEGKELKIEISYGNLFNSKGDPLTIVDRFNIKKYGINLIEDKYIQDYLEDCKKLRERETPTKEKPKKEKPKKKKSKKKKI